MNTPEGLSRRDFLDKVLHVAPTAIAATSAVASAASAVIASSMKDTLEDSLAAAPHSGRINSGSEGDLKALNATAATATVNGTAAAMMVATAALDLTNQAG